jgi:hypothetical protein
MHVLAAHPAAAPPLAFLAAAGGVLDHHRYSTKELTPPTTTTMDSNALRQIEEGFRLARELMEELPAAQNEPAYLADRCHGIAQAYVAAIRMLHPPANPPTHFGGSSQHDRVIPQLDLLRPFLSAPSAPSSSSTAFPHNLGRHQLLAADPSSFVVNASPVVAGTSSGGPVRRHASSSSRSSPPVQPRQQQHRRRYVRVPCALPSGVRWRTLGFSWGARPGLLVFFFFLSYSSFGGQEFKPCLAENLLPCRRAVVARNFPRTPLVFVLRLRRPRIRT